MNRIVLSATLAVVIVVAAMAAQAEASYVTLSDPNNVAPQAAIYSSSFPEWVTAANDRKVSDGVPGEASFEDTYHFQAADSDLGPSIILAWTTPQNLSSVQAYVCHGGPGDADRTVSSVRFLLDLPGGDQWDVVVDVPTANTNGIGCFDLTRLDGNWADVAQVGFVFTGSSGQGPRVAEVLAITSPVPEPSVVVLLGSGLFCLAACAWRKYT